MNPTLCYAVNVTFARWCRCPPSFPSAGAAPVCTWPRKLSCAPFPSLTYKYELERLIVKKKHTFRHSLAMHNDRSDASIAILTVVMILRLVDQFDHSAGHLRHLSFHRRPAVVLELGDLDGVLQLAIGYIEFAAGIVWTAFAVHILDEDVIVLDLVVGPVARAFLGCVADLRNMVCLVWTRCIWRMRTFMKKIIPPIS